MSDLLAFDPSDLWYIKLDGYGSKFPPDSWGGYSQSFVASDNVYTHEEVVKSDHEFWGVCGSQDIDHGSLALLVFDLDIHKAPEDFDADRVTVPEDTLVVRTQNGGFHVYFTVHAERGELQESDFQMTESLGWDVDIRGSAVSMHVVAPTEIPGNNSPYEVVENSAITAVFDASDAAERIRLDGEPLIEYDTGSRVGDGVEIDRDAKPPAEMPTCYHRGLQLRAAAPDNHPNTHKVNVLTALSGLAAGYEVETMVEHFCEDFPPGEACDREQTEYQLQHIARGVDRGEYSPPALSTLRDFGILDGDETCHCGIPYHGSTGGNSVTAAAHMLDQAATDGGAAAVAGGDSGGPEGPDGGRDWTLSPLDVLEVACRDPMHPADYDDEGGYDLFPRDLRANERGSYVWTLAKKTGDDIVLAQRHGPILAYNPDRYIWADDDRERLRDIANEALGSAFSANVVNEIEENIRSERVKDPDDLGAPDATVMTHDGLLDLRERTVEPGRRDHYARASIPTSPDWEAECPRWKAFLKEAIDTEHERLKFQEYCGYTLWRHAQIWGKALLLVGPTDSGKSTALKVIRAVLGDENVASESLQNLIETRWGKAQLVGNIANIREEVTPSGLSDIEAFKELTGGEAKVTAEYKGEQKFDFVVTQKFMFATNEVPSVQHADEAFYNRLLFVRFPNTVAPEDQDPQLTERLIEERAGILNWMLDGLDRLLDQEEFHGERSTPEKKELCDAFGGVIDRFTHNCLMITGNTDDVVSKADLHDLAHAYADDIDKEPDWGKQTGFTRQISNQRGIGQGKRRIEGEPEDVLTGVRVKPEVVYRYDMDIRAKCEDRDEPEGRGLHNYQDSDLRPGYDSREERNLVPLIVKTVQEHDSDAGMPHDAVVDELTERGIDRERLEARIEKALRRGDIHEPESDHYRTT